jgi:hypothetical protein
MGLALAGCAGGSGGGQMTWARTDGRPIDAGFTTAAQQCRSMASRVGSGAPRSEREETMKVAMESCMQGRGYVWQCESPLGGCGQGGEPPADKGQRPAAPASSGRSMT